MASYAASLVNEKTNGFVTASPNNLAVIHCGVSKTPGYFSTIVIEFSLDARWQMQYKGKQLSLDKINVQIGYERDAGEVTYKNSAPVINVNNASVVLPMIWTKDNMNYIYKATYTASNSLVLHCSYTIAFEINADLPPELQNLYTGKQDLAIDPKNPSVDYSVQISIN